MIAAPVVEHLTRRLAECPAEFLLEPRSAGTPGGQVDVEAVVADLLADLGLPGRLPAKAVGSWARAPAADRNLLQVTLVAAWLCHDPWLRSERRFGLPVLRWLAGGLRPLAGLVAAELFVTDADRREELARALLDALGVTPGGESRAQAADRLRALSSVERALVLRDTRAQAERARKLREQMASERAAQAAARYSSE